MIYEIDLTPTEEKRLSTAAKKAGVAPTELIKRLALSQISENAVGSSGSLDATLSQRQEQDGTALMSDIPAHSLIARWTEEDSQISDAQRKSEDQLWEEIERALTCLDRTFVDYLRTLPGDPQAIWTK